MPTPKKRIRPTERDKLREQLFEMREQRDFYRTKQAEASTERDVAMCATSTVREQLRETRQLLAEAVERTGHEPVVEWWRAARIAMKGDGE